jgi:hypothetical protein
MSRLARTLVLAAALAVMYLTGTTAVAQAQTTDDDAVERFRRGERASQEQTSTDAVELYRRGERASQVQTTVDAAVQRLLAREQFSIPSGMHAQVPAPVPAEASGQRGWVLASLGVLAAVLALAGALAALAVRRASRKVRAGQPA